MATGGSSYGSNTYVAAAGFKGPKDRMNHSGISGYKRLRELDPVLCQQIVRFSEDIVVDYKLDIGVGAVLKQSLCQFALDTMCRYATEKVFCGEP